MWEPRKIELLSFCLMNNKLVVGCHKDCLVMVDVVNYVVDRCCWTSKQCKIVHNVDEYVMMLIFCFIYCSLWAEEFCMCWFEWGVWQCCWWIFHSILFGQTKFVYGWLIWTNQEMYVLHFCYCFIELSYVQSRKFKIFVGLHLLMISDH